MIYVLAVGIDTYSGPSGVPALNGCAMDAWRFIQFLKETYGGDQVQERFLHNNQAKREALIDGFSSHLCQAGPDDVAIFYYSGHGSREASAPEFRDFFPDGMDETIVCFDSRTDGIHDLADKELAVLMSRVAEKGPDIVAILDKCHSGSAFRGLGEALGLVPKQVGSLDRERPLDTYVGYPEYFAPGKADIPDNSLIALTACDRYQRAYQDPDSGGIFTSALLQTMERLRDGGQLAQTSYADLFFKLRLAIRQIVDNQTPQLEVYGQYNAHTVLFKRGTTSEDIRFSVFFEPGKKAWQLNAGALHGLISDPAIIEEGRVVLFEDGEACGEARLVSIGVTHSKLKPLPGTTVEKGKTYQAELVNVLIEPLAIALLPGQTPPAAVAAVRLGEKSGFYRFVEPADAARYRLELGPDGYALLLTGTRNPLYTSPRQSGWQWDAATTAMLAGQLRKLAAWERVLQLNNPRALEIGEKLPLTFVLDESETVFQNSEVTLPIPDEWVKNRRGHVYRLDLQNTTRANLKMIALHLQSDFGIAAQEEEPLAPGKKQTIRKKIIGIADARHLEETDVYKIIIAHGSQTLDSSLFTQSGLDSSARDLRGDSDQIKKINRNFWTTKTLIVHSVRELAAYEGAELKVEYGDLRFGGHPSLRARVALRSGRYVALSQTPGQVLTALAQKRGWPVLSLYQGAAHEYQILELYDLAGTVGVTAEAPLQITLPGQPPLGVVVVALTFNGYEPVVCGEGKAEGKDTTVDIPKVLPNANNFRANASTFPLCFLMLKPAQLSSPEFRQIRSL